MNTVRRKKPRWVILTAALAAGFLAATARYEPTPLRAGIRKSAPREAFLSGSERSIPILLEISATLKRIDDRLARIEKSWDAQGKRK